MLAILNLDGKTPELRDSINSTAEEGAKDLDRAPYTAQIFQTVLLSVSDRTSTGRDKPDEQLHQAGEASSI